MPFFLTKFIDTFYRILFCQGVPLLFHTVLTISKSVFKFFSSGILYLLITNSFYLQTSQMKDLRKTGAGGKRNRIVPSFRGLQFLFYSAFYACEEKNLKHSRVFLFPTSFLHLLSIFMYFLGHKYIELFLCFITNLR